MTLWKCKYCKKQIPIPLSFCSVEHLRKYKETHKFIIRPPRKITEIKEKVKDKKVKKVKTVTNLDKWLK